MDAYESGCWGKDSGPLLASGGSRLRIAPGVLLVQKSDDGDEAHGVLAQDRQYAGNDKKKTAVSE